MIVNMVYCACVIFVFAYFNIFVIEIDFVITSSYGNLRRLSHAVTCMFK